VMVKNLVIKAIKETFKEKYSIDLDLNTDIMLFSSHGKNKKSYHIVLHMYSVSTNEEVKCFVEDVHDKLAENKENQVGHFLDIKVYGKKQLFRTYGSSKKGRVKILVKKWKFFNDTVEFILNPSQKMDEVEQYMEETQNSLISFTGETKMLPNHYVDRRAKRAQSSYGDTEDLPVNRVEEMMDLCRVKSRSGKFFPFVIRPGGITGNVVILNRIDKSPVWCKRHGRNHTGENPYIILCGTSVYFNCRRPDNQGRYDDSLGELVGNISEVSIQTNIRFNIEDGDIVLMNKEDEVEEARQANRGSDPENTVTAASASSESQTSEEENEPEPPELENDPLPDISFLDMLTKKKSKAPAAPKTRSAYKKNGFSEKRLDTYHKIMAEGV
jgi:hypothetical protein